jgi:PTH1 family peptidyl-tRNA hydrolase
MLEHRKAIDDSIFRALTALPLLLAGDMEKAMVRIHTSKPPRPKPPRPPKVPNAEAPEIGAPKPD